MVNEICPWIDDIENVEIPYVPQPVKDASSGHLSDLSLLTNIRPDGALTFDYAAAVQHAMQHGTPEDIETISKWGRDNHDKITAKKS